MAFTYYQLRTRQTFDDFCQDFKEEIGETLFNKCNPKLVKTNIIQVFIPNENKNRLKESLHYGKANVIITHWINDKRFTNQLTNN